MIVRCVKCRKPFSSEIKSPLLFEKQNELINCPYCDHISEPLMEDVASALIQLMDDRRGII